MAWKNPGLNAEALTAANDMLGEDNANNSQATTLVTANRDGSLVERIEYLYDLLVDDEATNFIGVDDANNVAATTNVAANADGSILERLEYLQANLTSQTPATFVPGLGYRVTKTEDVNAATSDDLFDVTGKVLITLWTIEVTNAIDAAVNDYILRIKTDNVALTASSDIGSAAVGVIMNVTGDAGDTLETAGEGVKTCDHSDSGPANRIVGLAGGTCTLQSVRTAGAASDAMIHVLFYLPLEASATVVASA
jgi:hypothetical protein